MFLCQDRRMAIPITDASHQPPKASPLVLWLALLEVGLHLATATRYGIFRDELYCIACARHLDFGYVDHPPLIAVTTWLVLHLFGSSLLALRLLPALASGLLVWMTGRIAFEWGGGRFAQGMAALAIIPVPIYLILQHWLTMNAFEPLFWTGVLWAASRLILRQEPRYWLVIGLLVGIGLENKYSMLFLAGVLVFGLLLTPERRWLANRHFVSALVIAVLLFLPNLVWLVHHDFPFLEFERNSRQSGSRILRGPVSFLWDQALIMNPVLAPLWLTGLVSLFLRRAQSFRFIGWAVCLLLALLVGIQAKNYYVAPIYPVLFVAGALAFERFTASSRLWMRPAYAFVIVLSGLLLSPLVMPLLSVPHLLAYQRLWNGFTPVVFEDEPARPLPQYFADEFGWEDMARETGKVYAQLPEATKSTTAIFTNDYGQASAIDFFGPRYGLPPSISKAETFWLWGPRNYTGSTVIVLGSNGKGDHEFFRTVEAVGRVNDSYSRADERFEIFLCRDMHPELQILWPKIKAW